MLGVIRRPSRVAASDREAHPDSLDWSGVLPGGAAVVGRPTRMVRRPSWRPGVFDEALPEGWEWSGGSL